MNTLKAPIHGHMPVEDHRDDHNAIHDSESKPEVWFFVITSLLLIIGSFYLLWAKVSGAWPFAFH